MTKKTNNSYSSEELAMGLKLMKSTLPLLTKLISAVFSKKASVEIADSIKEKIEGSTGDYSHESLKEVIDALNKVKLSEEEIISLIYEALSEIKIMAEETGFAAGGTPVEKIPDKDSGPVKSLELMIKLLFDLTDLARKDYEEEEEKKVMGDESITKSIKDLLGGLDLDN